VTETDPGMVARVAALESALARLEALLGGSTSIIEGLNFPEGLRIPAGQGITLAPGAAPDVSEGRLYYDADANAVKLRGASAWETVLSQLDAQIDSSNPGHLISTTTETQIMSVTLGFPRAGKLLIWYTCNPYCAANGKWCRFNLKIGGSTKMSNTYAQEPSGSYPRQQVAYCWLETISASGNQIVTITAQNQDATFTTVFNDSRLLALALPI